MPLLYRLAERVALLRGSLLAVLGCVAGSRCGSHLWVVRGVVLKYPLHPGITLSDRRIGEHCVTNRLPPSTLSVGSPARVLRQRG